MTILNELSCLSCPWVGQEMGGVFENFFWHFEISFPWVFQRYICHICHMTTRNEDPFWYFRVQNQLLGRTRKRVGKVNFCLTFQNLLFMGFSTVYHTSLLHEHLFLNHFWSGHEVGGVGQNISGFETLS